MLAILLIAHGSRRDQANADLLWLADAVRERRVADLVEVAYLELVEPDIPAGLGRCAEAGATEIRMIPYFLSMGRHVTEHLEEFRRDAEQRYQGVRVVLRDSLGPHEKLVEIVLDRIEEP